MTPGQEALVEAARLESGRVYSTVVRERRRQVRTLADDQAERDALIRRLHAEGNSLAVIALRVGLSKTGVHKALARAS